MAPLSRSLFSGRCWRLLGLMSLLATAPLVSACKGPEPVRYQTTEVDRGDIVSKVTASGTLSALVTVQVGSQVSGRVLELFADFNSKVQKGEVVARIDPKLFETAVEQARANLSAAQSRLVSARAKALDAKRNAERMRSLAEKQLVAEADAQTADAQLEIANADVSAAESAIEQARASLHQAEANLAYTTIVSPIDGVVISRNVDVGQTVAASFQAPVLFTIAEDLGRMQVETSISEADVGRLEAGRKATFTVDAWPNRTFEGTIRQIRNAPQVVQNVVTYLVIIDVENPELLLRPGMTANVTIEVDRRDDALRIPNTALHYRPPDQAAKNGKSDKNGKGGKNGKDGKGGKDGKSGDDKPRTEGKDETDAPTARARDGARTVWILDNGDPRSLSIQPGLSDGVYTEVVGGDLSEGALIITDSSGGKPGGSSPFMPSHDDHRGGRR